MSFPRPYPVTDLVSPLPALSAAVLISSGTTTISVRLFGPNGQVVGYADLVVTSTAALASSLITGYVATMVGAEVYAVSGSPCYWAPAGGLGAGVVPSASRGVPVVVGTVFGRVPGQSGLGVSDLAQQDAEPNFKLLKFSPSESGTILAITADAQGVEVASHSFAVLAASLVRVAVTTGWAAAVASAQGLLLRPPATMSLNVSFGDNDTVPSGARQTAPGSQLAFGTCRGWLL